MSRAEPVNLIPVMMETENLGRRASRRMSHMPAMQWHMLPCCGICLPCRKVHGELTQGTYPPMEVKIGMYRMSSSGNAKTLQLKQKWATLRFHNQFLLLGYTDAALFPTFPLVSVAILIKDFLFLLMGRSNHESFMTRPSSHDTPIVLGFT